MAETTNTQKVAPKKATPKKTVAPKAEAKTATPKVATPKTEAPKAKTKVAPPKQEVTTTNDSTLTDIMEDQYEASADTIINALNTLDKQLQDARDAGSDRAKEIVEQFGGENKLTELISKLAGYMGEAAGAGMVVGMSPMIIMAGAAKGVYKKITD